jgi:hypothetical protein
MAILRFADAPEFDLSGIRVRGLASPSRGSTESMTYRLDVAGGQHVPAHTHDHEEVSHLLSGRWTVTIIAEAYRNCLSDSAWLDRGFALRHGVRMMFVARCKQTTGVGSPND